MSRFEFIISSILFFFHDQQIPRQRQRWPGNLRKTTANHVKLLELLVPPICNSILALAPPTSSRGFVLTPRKLANSGNEMFYFAVFSLSRVCRRNSRETGSGKRESRAASWFRLVYEMRLHCSPPASFAPTHSCPFPPSPKTKSLKNNARLLPSHTHIKHTKTTLQATLTLT